MSVRDYKPGEWVIFTKLKVSENPGPRARDIDPAPRGDLYRYRVDKFWVVEDQRDDGKLVLLTRRGKRHVVDPETADLRPVRWWERIRYRDRFPTLDEALSARATS